MGTRADFYVGRGKSSEWIGSTGLDGYPEGPPSVLGGITDEAAYRRAVEGLTSHRSGTKPAQGWPWPWRDSNTTDYAYAFDEGRVWGACFGKGWWPFELEPADLSEVPKGIEWPEVPSCGGAPAGSDRSGIIVVTPRG